MGKRDGRSPIQGGGAGSAVLDGWEEVNATTIKPKLPYTSVLIPGDLEVQGDTTLADQVIATGDIYAGAAFDLGFTGRAKFKSPADGVLTLLNAAEADFTRLQFGGTSASFPAIKRSSAALHFRLADDSAFAAISCAGITAGDNVVVTGYVSASTQLVAVGAGSSGAPSVLIGQAQGTAGPEGFFRRANSVLNVALAGTDEFEFAVGAFLIPSDALLKWSSTTTPSGTADWAIARTSAGLGQIENGAGTLEDLKADYFWLVNEGTNGTDACTLLNGPAGTAGDPNKWLKVKGSDGTVYVVPAWTPT